MRTKLNLENGHQGYIGVDLNLNLSNTFSDTELNIINGKITFHQYDDDTGDYDECGIVIGNLNAFYLNNHFENFCSQLDGYSYDSQQYMKELCHKIYDRLLENCQNLLILNVIKIREEFRGNGIIKKVIEILNHYFKCPILIKPYPLQHADIINNNKKLFDYEQYKKDLKKVKMAYRKCGFKTYRRNSEFMMCYG
jgi:hypothetical protein